MLETGRPEEALNLTNVLMRAGSSGDTDLLALRARCLYIMGEVENSIKHMQQALRADPDNTVIRSTLRRYKEIEESKEKGNSAFKTAQYPQAIEAWTSCISLCGDCPKLLAKLLCNRASAQCKLQVFAEALKDCSQAIQHDRHFWKAYIRRAECNMGIGGKEKIQEAITDYEKALELNPEGESDIKKKIQSVSCSFYNKR
jgi:DnaJ homolog subfamily C member 7